MKKTILILFIILSNFVFADIFDDVKNNDIEAVKKYIQEGGDAEIKNNNGETLLHIACKYTDNEEVTLQIVTLLLNNGAKINQIDSFGNTPLHNAVPIHKKYH